MTYSSSELVVLFFTYSVIGWLWETIYCSLKDGHYDYRGFLFGPILSGLRLCRHHDLGFHGASAGQSAAFICCGLNRFHNF